MTDIALKYGNSFVADFAVVNGDIAVDDGLETAITISLFTDLEADQSEIDSGLVDEHGGWWGNKLLEPENRTGSRIWTLRRSRLNTNTLNALQSACEEALEWLKDENAADRIIVTTAKVGNDTAAIYIDIYRPDGSNPSRFEYTAFWSK